MRNRRIGVIIPAPRIVVPFGCLLAVLTAPAPTIIMRMTARIGLLLAVPTVHVERSDLKGCSDRFGMAVRLLLCFGRRAVVFVVSLLLGIAGPSL